LTGEITTQDRLTTALYEQ